MNTFWKLSLTSVAALLFLGILLALYKGFEGNYFLHTSMVNTGLIFVGVIVLGYLIIKFLKNIWASVVFILMLAILGSCNYAKSNQQVVVSDDCGKSWEEINAGESVPKAGMNPCYMKVVMPNYPMQGESRFVANLKEKVRVLAHIDYDYSIIQALAFIKQAKYLGSANRDADSTGALDAQAFEGAENMVIDKRLRDVAKRLFVNEDIVELDLADLENSLLEEANKVLEPLGVKLNFITLTFELDEQTRQAIDVSTAMKIYASKNLQQIGGDVIIQRAGAPKIIVETKSEEKTGE